MFLISKVFFAFQYKANENSKKLKEKLIKVKKKA
jgi:hypothetical protein